MSDIYFQGKLIVIKVHAIKRAREREIAFPDQVYDVSKTAIYNNLLTVFEHARKS